MQGCSGTLKGYLNARADSRIVCSGTGSGDRYDRGSEEGGEAKGGRIAAFARKCVEAQKNPLRRSDIATGVSQTSPPSSELGRTNSMAFTAASPPSGPTPQWRSGGPTESSGGTGHGILLGRTALREHRAHHRSAAPPGRSPCASYRVRSWVARVAWARLGRTKRRWDRTLGFHGVRGA